MVLYDQFVLFGDSITQDSCNQERGFGFSAALQHAYIRRLDVVNRGLSGYNSRQALAVVPSVIPKPEDARIRFLLVFFGANDACNPREIDDQHVPLPEYKSNLEKIITHPLIQAHSPRIILIAPPPINEHLQWVNDKEKGHPSVTRIAANTKAYADGAVEVGKKLNIPVVNLWEAFMSMAGFSVDTWKPNDSLPGSLDVPQNDTLVKLMHDGLHFNPAGYEVLHRGVMKVIAEQWPDQMPEQLSMVLPGWNDPGAWKEYENSK